MPQEDQPGDLRVNRGHILRRISRATWPDGPKPGLPAPNRIEFTPSLALYFDSLADAEQWATRYDLHPRVTRLGDIHQLVATGEWEGVDIGVVGDTRATAPAHPDLDDLSDVIAKHYDASAYADEYVCACGDAFGSEEALMGHVAEVNAKSIEDAPPRGTDADEVHVPPPADVEVYTHERGRPEWAAQPSGEQPIIEPLLKVTGLGDSLSFGHVASEGGAIVRWTLTGPAGTVTFEVAHAAGVTSPSVFVQPAGGGEDERDALSGQLARQLHQAFVAEGEPAVREQLEHWYGEHLVGASAEEASE